MTAMSPGKSGLVRFLVMRPRRAAPITPGRSSVLPRRVQGRRRDGLFIALPSCQTGRVAVVTRAIAACYRRARTSRAGPVPGRALAGIVVPPSYLGRRSLSSTGSGRYGRVDNGDHDAATRQRQPDGSTRALISDGNHHPPAARPAVGGLTPFTTVYAPGGRDGRPLSEEDAEGHVHGICFKTGPPGQVGVELEWLVGDRRDPALPVQADRITHAIAS